MKNRMEIWEIYEKNQKYILKLGLVMGMMGWGGVEIEGEEIVGLESKNPNCYKN